MKSSLGALPAVNKKPETPAEDSSTEALEGSEQTKLISDKMEGLLIAQIGHEMFALYEYAAIACKFDKMGLTGFAAWANKQSGDELTHAQKIINFLIELDIAPALPAIEAAKADVASVKDAVIAIMAREKSVTADWNAIGQLAMEEKDLASLRLAQWFIDEQIEEENTVGTLLSKIEIAGDGSGILVIDSMLTEQLED